VPAADAGLRSYAAVVLCRDTRLWASQFGIPFHDMKQVPSSCTQALDVLAHSLMLCLGVIFLLEAKLVIEAVSDSPPKFLRY
jgi:hypothetical protein